MKDTLLSIAKDILLAQIDNGDVEINNSDPSLSPAEQKARVDRSVRNGIASSVAIAKELIAACEMQGQGEGEPQSTEKPQRKPKPAPPRQ